MTGKKRTNASVENGIEESEKLRVEREAEASSLFRQRYELDKPDSKSTQTKPVKRARRTLEEES